MSTLTLAASLPRPAVDITDPGEAVREIWRHMADSGDWYRRNGRAWRRDPGSGQPRQATAQDVKVWVGLHLAPYKVSARGEVRPAAVSGALASMALEPEAPRSRRS
ncbi:hypothetical protein [Streptomyces sp. NPDC002851]